MGLYYTKCRLYYIVLNYFTFLQQNQPFSVLLILPSPIWPSYVADPHRYRAVPQHDRTAAGPEYCKQLAPAPH